MQTKEYREKWRRENWEKDLASKKRYRIKHQDELNFKARQKNLEKKTMIMTHYTQGKNTCQWKDCNINDIDMLAIDHINNGGGKHRKELGTHMRYHDWLIKNNFPAGFQILCANHNIKKEALRRRKEGKISKCNSL